MGRHEYPLPGGTSHWTEQAQGYPYVSGSDAQEYCIRVQCLVPWVVEGRNVATRHHVSPGLRTGIEIEWGWGIPLCLRGKRNTMTIDLGLALSKHDLRIRVS